MFEPSEELFIQNICSHPGDNLAVGVYGDWLEEQGSDKAVRVQNFYRGLPLSNDLNELCGQLSPEQQLTCAILLAKDVLSVFEKDSPDYLLIVEAIKAVDNDSDSVLNAAGLTWDIGFRLWNQNHYAAANAAWVVAHIAHAKYDFGVYDSAPDLTLNIEDTIFYALRAKPERRDTYLLVFSSFILFGCNVVSLD